MTVFDEAHPITNKITNKDVVIVDTGRFFPPPCEDHLKEDKDDEIYYLMAVFNEAYPITNVNDVNMGDVDAMTAKPDSVLPANDNKRTRHITGRPKWTYFLELEHRKRSEFVLLNKITVSFTDKKNEAKLLGKTLAHNVLQHIIDEFK